MPLVLVFVLLDIDIEPAEDCTGLANSAGGPFEAEASPPTAMVAAPLSWTAATHPTRAPLLNVKAG